MGDQPSDTHFPAFFIVRNPDDSNLSACCKFGKVVFDTHRAQFGIGQFENAQVIGSFPIYFTASETAIKASECDNPISNRNTLRC